MEQIKWVLFFQPVYYLTKITHKLIANYWNWFNNQKVKHFAEHYNRIVFRGRTIVRFGENIHVIIGKDLNINSGDFCINSSNTSKIIVYDNATFVVGNNVGISQSAIVSHCSVIIGDNVDIGGGCVIYTSDFHSLDWRIRITKEDQKKKKNAPVIIKDNVFIGARSMILKGVVIGENSIVGAGSVVTKSIPANQIWAGNPARFIRNIE